MVAMWVAAVLLVVLGCATLVMIAWLRGRQRTVASRHRAWVEISRALPAGSSLAGLEPDGSTLVEIAHHRGERDVL